ncbi:ATP-dependent RecD-like DNA helicase [Synergistales bacterium]|nr:ATP-dependent RecD-like DNA helicase [Synergistales bacterium]
MERLRCIVERITYSNDINGFCVLRTRVKNYSDLVTVVGNMSNVNVGSVLLLMGEWKIDKKFGQQFLASSYEEVLPATVIGIERYLGGGMIKGIGPKFARKIVNKFGADTLAVIEETPDKLIEIEGIGDKRVATIKKAWQDQKEVRNIMLFLQEHQVSATHAVKIFKTYGNESISIVKDNPYKLADDIWGIGFKTADTIAMKMGFDKESYYRCRSGLLYVLNEFTENGDCYAAREELLKKSVSILEVDEAILSESIEKMISKNDIVREAPDKIYLLPLYYSEKGTSHRLRDIMASERQILTTDIETSIKTAEKVSKLSFDTIQKDAIREASISKVMVLTGGPGTGKTTTTKGIIATFTEQGLKILLAAPTGRAAKRLSETTGMEAKTIHRLLESKPPEGYNKNEDNPLDGDVLIVDESSMIDIVLMYNLLKAVPDKMTVIFVGDSDQLPSVGAGNVLLDIINSGVIPVIKLTRIYRQAQSSQIIMNAHRINHGEFPNLNSGKKSDFFFIEESEPANIPALICELCVKRLPGYYHIDPVQGIQVLSPMQRTETGALNLNMILQNALNPNKECLKRGGTEFRLGDKVMQIKNNYEKDIFNGDIGIVSKVDTEERELMVTFDGSETSYDVSELDELVLAYATTIHKAQGSEYPIVIIPITTQHYMMLQRNLLYTGITRAKRVLVLIGAKKAIGIAIRNNKVIERNTGLAERLRRG